MLLTYLYKLACFFHYFLSQTHKNKEMKDDKNARDKEDNLELDDTIEFETTSRLNIFLQPTTPSQR